MNPATLIPGVALGLGAAFLLHGIFSWLRRSRLVGLIRFIGWLCALVTLAFPPYSSSPICK